MDMQLTFIAVSIVILVFIITFSKSNIDMEFAIKFLQTLVKLSIKKKN
ncbi:MULTISPECIES: hypothetical protein [Thermoanaerobacterium]|jgi:hypothetical protein|uniref:Uncharacterized protein n=2 Tax=Thermoanaerobacterium TaxID=28895 RepID=W9E7Q6_9THEO|nr:MULTISPECIES: hypothetical protein [Thermoanaerobacterium]MDI3309924.1 hypothetical protein [Thermoanaerobacterium sp.]AFK87607.1 hypothetical protein Tsac_2611 [Thermoanaerobacterium saccharolyticum JW/SL-YS485]ETO37542.1 hypothetical protein V518_2234 [Thermoanaerobacterium aotearoense SCUT27]MDE4542493.1 hypothetical protein [Thermoanaerobacterium sp. R66]HHV74848.1 hypothetical protein [Thermoanaerobacterium sp.]